ncbi:MULTISPECIES: sn-glycerol-1-phosphate dehydrogenase [Bacillus]|uniref:sn-glycerol-1-phosphate dehydrogenase n=1 Tax=Bacillus velezensis TaxID=492670 RepID=UPI0011ACEF42|nr:sn-glycerol-1-phosphate dehydrogenase [Bacillus velezensis]NRR27875.1 sn-glycerol-1-phosphate dehydrogenase [Bacillus velezensis]TWO93792.1 sn-glycerol-1-phosphate dehydrogenase [Bacillus velezensis]WFO86293.1 sn-glycerol-1-phosphate dehydrogenase [Bacillus velezensis]
MKRSPEDIQSEFDKEGASRSPIQIEDIVIGANAKEELLRFLQKKCWNHPVLVCDRNTYEAAGRLLADELRAGGIKASKVIIPEHEAGAAAADERTLVYTLINLAEETDVIIAAGSGTIHDITRFAAYQRGLPFISFPTAPSVDGFTSAGAPLILNGIKTTIQTKAPIALFADTNVLKEAPRSMTAAGFGDMLGKITSLADWEISRRLAGEPYSEAGAKLVKDALWQCIDHRADIAMGTEAGIQILMEALIVSGLVMLALDHSRPASGGEHHISHWIEMEMLKAKQPPILHGAKVGCACAVLSDIYKELACHEKLAELPPHFREAIQSAYEGLPDGKTIAGWLSSAGGPACFDEIGVKKDLVSDALKHAYTLRDRYTGLTIINENAALFAHHLHQ